MIIAYGLPDIYLQVLIKNGSSTLLESTVISLFLLWEETSYKLERLQTNADIAQKEFDSLAKRTGPKYKLTFDPSVIPKPSRTLTAGKYYMGGCIELLFENLE